MPILFSSPTFNNKMIPNIESYNLSEEALCMFWKVPKITESGDRETAFVTSKDSPRLKEVVHKGEQSTFKVSEDNVEVGDKDSNTRERRYTEKEKRSINRFITRNGCDDNVKGQYMWQEAGLETCPGTTQQSINEHFNKMIPNKESSNLSQK
jgi:hypothetical protein